MPEPAYGARVGTKGKHSAITDRVRAFLGVPAPDNVPFLLVNDTAAFRPHARNQAAWNILRFGGATVAGVAGVSVLAWLGWRAMQT